MASLNPLTRELVFKIVFYGPGLGGKTTTLQYIHAATKPEHRGKMVSLATAMDRTLYFDFLPIRVPRVRGMSVRLQLFTVPGQVYYGATRKLVLTGSDGVVFVADSQQGRLDANQESLEDLEVNLADHNRTLEQVPHTFHWNKRDLSDLVPIAELDRKFNAHAAPSLGTVATQGEGVFEGLERITRLVVRAYESDLPKGERSLETRHESSEAGIADAIRGLTELGDRRSVTPFTGIPAVTIKPPTEAAPDRRDKDPPTSPPVAAKPEEPTAAPPIAPGGRPTEGSPALSFVDLWTEAERETARESEVALGAGDPSRAVLACELLVMRLLASAAGLVGTVDAPRDPGLVALLLGLDGRRYLKFRAHVRAARQGQVTMRDALDCYAFALEARRAREAIDR
jgi:signal recognition particle receptor subunit beta